MQPRLQRRVQRYGWDRAAAAYEPSWQAQLAPAHELMLQMADLRPGERVLDVACGTGLVSFRAAAAVGAGGAVVGTDISGEMVEAAARVASLRGMGHVRFERADAEDLPFADACFDAAMCGLGLMYVPDPVRALREMRRVLRPGGQGGRGRLGCAQRLWLGRDLPDRRRPRRLRRLPAVLPPRHPRHARRAASRPPASPTSASSGSRPSCATPLPRRHWPRRFAAARWRWPTAASTRRRRQAVHAEYLEFHRRLCGGRWLPDPGRVRRCRRPDDRSICPATQGDGRCPKLRPWSTTASTSRRCWVPARR